MAQDQKILQAMEAELDKIEALRRDFPRIQTFFKGEQELFLQTVRELLQKEKAKPKAVLVANQAEDGEDKIRKRAFDTLMRAKIEQILGYFKYSRSKTPLTNDHLAELKTCIEKSFSKKVHISNAIKTDLLGVVAGFSGGITLGEVNNKLFSILRGWQDETKLKDHYNTYRAFYRQSKKKKEPVDLLGEEIEFPVAPGLLDVAFKANFFADFADPIQTSSLLEEKLKNNNSEIVKPITEQANQNQLQTNQGIAQINQNLGQIASNQMATLLSEVRTFYSSLDTLVNSLGTTTCLVENWAEIKAYYQNEPFLASSFNHKLWEGLADGMELGVLKTRLKNNVKSYLGLKDEQLAQWLQDVKAFNGQVAAQTIITKLQQNCDSPRSRYQAWLKDARQKNEAEKKNFSTAELSWAKFSEQIQSLKDGLALPTQKAIADEWREQVQKSLKPETPNTKLKRTDLHTVLDTVLQDYQEKSMQLKPDSEILLEDWPATPPMSNPYTLGQVQAVNQTTVHNHTHTHQAQPSPKPQEVADEIRACQIAIEGSYNMGFKCGWELVETSTQINGEEFNIWKVQNATAGSPTATEVTLTVERPIILGAGAPPQGFVTNNSPQGGNWWRFPIQTQLILKTEKKTIVLQDIVEKIAKLDTNTNLLNTGTGVFAGALMAAPEPWTTVVGLGLIAGLYAYGFYHNIQEKNKLELLKEIEIPSLQVPLTCTFYVGTAVLKNDDGTRKTSNLYYGDVSLEVEAAVKKLFLNNSVAFDTLVASLQRAKKTISNVR